MEAGLPAARSALQVRRQWSETSDPEREHSHTRTFITSLAPEQKERAAQGAREHWSVENRNHHKRDASAWQEDKHRHRRPRAALNLALTRNALLAIIPFEQGQPLADFFETYHRTPRAALHLILNSRPFP